MSSIPKVTVRLSDTYKAAFEEIKKTISAFRNLDAMYDPYMIEETIRNAIHTAGEADLPDDYDFGLDLESLYINISDLPTIINCNSPSMSLLEYAFRDSDLKLWFYVTANNLVFAFIQVPLSHVLTYSNHY